MYGQTGQIGKWTTMPIAHMREPRIEANSSHSPTFVRSKFDLSLPQNGKRGAKRAWISIVWICKEGWAEMEKILSHYTFVTTINNNKGCMLTHSSNIRHAKRYKENQPFFNLDAVFWFVLTRNESHCISRDTHSIHPIIRGQLAQNELAFLFVFSKQISLTGALPFAASLNRTDTFIISPDIHPQAKLSNILI